jgi:hypothetical protein
MQVVSVNVGLPRLVRWRATARPISPTGGGTPVVGMAVRRPGPVRASGASTASATPPIRSERRQISRPQRANASTRAREPVTSASRKRSGLGAPAELQVVARASESERVLDALERSPGVASVAPPERRGGLVWTRVRPVSEGTSIVDGLRSRLPDGALVGGAAAEAHDLEGALARGLPLV